MADQDRLSHARRVDGLHQEPSSLDQQGQSNPQFNQAAAQGDHAAFQGRGSEMVEKDGSRMHHRPPEEISRDQTSQDFNKAWTGEQRAAARAQQLRDRYAAKSQSDNHKEQQGHQQRPGQRM